MVFLMENILLVYIVILFSFIFIGCLSSFILFNKQQVFKLFYTDSRIESHDEIPVSLLVPAYNEEVTIIQTINSLSHLDYKQFEIIVINDGSRDGTLKKIMEHYQLTKVYKPMRKQIETKEVVGVYQGKIGAVELLVIDKINGGKADTLNMGINYSKYPIFITIDADSILEVNSLKNIISPFMENRKTVAVGGNIKIANNLFIRNGRILEKATPKGYVVCHQISEYIRTFLTTRMMWDLINMNLIISGAFGAFNKRVVIDVGGYKCDTIGEDMELVMRIHKKFLKGKEEYYIKYAPNAYCYTQAPDRLKGLKIQRRRWQMGLIQSLITHKELFLSWNWFLAKMYYFLFELITPIVEVLGLAISILGVLFGFLDFDYIIRLYLLILAYNFVVTIFAIFLELYSFKEETNGKIILKLIVLSTVENIGYRQLVTLYRFTAFINYKKNKHQWGSIQRKSHNELV